MKLFKLLALMLLLNEVALANPNIKIENFLKESFRNNPEISELDVSVIETVAIPAVKNWSALIVSVNAKVKSQAGLKQVKQKMIWFTNGQIITKDFINIETGKSLKESIQPTFKSHQYKKENLISGNQYSKHKIAIFSDPLCKFCKSFVTSAITEMKKHPRKFAIYYYHYPLVALHPAAVDISKAAISAQLQGHEDVILRMHSVDINPKEKNLGKILKAFNKAMKTKIKPNDLRSSSVIKRFKSDAMTADDLMISGAPTLFFDNKIDRSKIKWKQIINQ